VVSQQHIPPLPSGTHTKALGLLPAFPTANHVAINSMINSRFILASISATGVATMNSSENKCSCQATEKYNIPPPTEMRTNVRKR
jgi:hypothetical protein